MDELARASGAKQNPGTRQARDGKGAKEVEAAVGPASLAARESPKNEPHLGPVAGRGFRRRGGHLVPGAAPGRRCGARRSAEREALPASAACDRRAGQPVVGRFHRVVRWLVGGAESGLYGGGADARYHGWISLRRGADGAEGVKEGGRRCPYRRGGM